MMKFLNFDSYVAGGGFAATNEDPELHAKLLDEMLPVGQRFKAAASICSGGEVPFFALAPRCEVIIAVDHSLSSLSVAYAKALLLKNLGAARTVEILTSNHDAIRDALAPFKDQFPSALCNVASILDRYTFHDVQREWRVPSLDVVQAAVDNLHRIHFVHGDFSDLQGYAKFDVLYFSNAFEHSGRHGKPDAVKHIDPLVKEGSLLLCTALPYSSQSRTVVANSFEERWDKVKEVRASRSSWIHYLHRRKAIVKESKKENAA